MSRKISNLGAILMGTALLICLVALSVIVVGLFGLGIYALVTGQGIAYGGGGPDPVGTRILGLALTVVMMLALGLILVLAGEAFDEVHR